MFYFHLVLLNYLKHKKLTHVALLGLGKVILRNSVRRTYTSYEETWTENSTLHSLKMFTLKIEKNSSWVDFEYFREKMHFLALELIFASSSWRVYMYTEFDIWYEWLEWYKKRSSFAKWAILNNSDALAATRIKWKK